MIRSASCARWCIAVMKHSLEFRALLSRASVAARVDAVPQFRVIRQKSQLARSPVSVSFSQSRICANQSTSSMPFSTGWSVHLVHFLPAQKIRAALHHRHFQIRREMFLQEGNVLLEELLLQRFRRRGNHHAPPAANRRNQIRQRLSGSRARFHDRVLVLRESVVHHLRHLQLRRAMSNT